MSAFADTVHEEESPEVKPLKTGKTGALLATYRNGIKAVLKLAKDALDNGHKTQRNIPIKDHPRHEVAFYQLAVLLGFDEIVPETVLIEYEGKECSAQHFIPAVHLAQLNARLLDHSDRVRWRCELKNTTLLVPKRFWRQLLVLDLIAGSRDRHINNVGYRIELDGNRPIYRLVAWDNAATFGHTFNLYHNVFHKLLFRHHANLVDVWPLVEELEYAEFVVVLEQYLTRDRIDHAWMRVQWMREFPYKLNWKMMSQGHDDSDEFPNYSEWFRSLKPSITAPVLLPQSPVALASQLGV